MNHRCGQRKFLLHSMGEVGHQFFVLVGQLHELK